MAFWVKDIGIDLGTSNTLICDKEKGILLSAPSVISMYSINKEKFAIGQDAKDMIGRAPIGVEVITPLKDGVISDFDYTQIMLRDFVKQINTEKALTRLRAIIGVPSDVTEIERRAVREVAMAAGAKEVLLIEEPMASAIGSGISVEEPNGAMIVDIGGGITEIAVISLGGIVMSKSIRVAGDDIDEAIKNYIKREYNVVIGIRTAEEIKINIGTVRKNKKIEKMSIKGRDLVTGLPKAISIDSYEIQEVMREIIDLLIDAIKYSIERTPPELIQDIRKAGIMLAGGGAMLDGFKELLEESMGMTVILAENPLDTTINGINTVLNDIDKYNKVVF